MRAINRIHITGASGCGTTTLGQALAKQLQFAVLDADDFFWEPTTPPYQKKRNRPDRLAMILQALSNHPQAIVSGSICGWGDALEQSFDLVIFLTVRTEVRIKRLLAREQAKLGYIDHEFITWAGQYDTGGLEMRSRALHEKWLAEMICPIIRLDGENPIAMSVDAVLRTIDERR
ncbi:MAG: AAA family ATPase [Phycisphaerales bacterium]|nr:AAA family ATPase [Phycisphaerales bacterium]